MDVFLNVYPATYGTMYIVIHLDKRKESIQRPITRVGAHQRAFSGPVRTLALRSYTITTGPHVFKVNVGNAFQWIAAIAIVQ